MKGVPRCTPQVAVRQTLLPTTMRWLPHNTGYFLILFYTTALVINLMGCIWCMLCPPYHRWLAAAVQHRCGAAHCPAA